MKKGSWPWLASLLAWSLVGSTGRAAEFASPRFAVVVGSNRGDASEVPLHYAEDDARHMAETLRVVGRFPADQITVVTSPTADELRGVLVRINARLRQLDSDTLLFVFFSGHGDAESLHLGGTRLASRELTALLAGSPASSRVLVVDACRSGGMTRVKGGTPVAPFAVLPDLPAPPHGFAILTSSGSTEDAQESDALRSSFFTHFLSSGLMGAADENQDGLVTLAEAFTFASGETLAATTRTAAGPQHPTYHYELGGRQDLVLARPRALEGNAGGLRLHGWSGRYFVHELGPGGARRLVAEGGTGARGAQIALPAGRYEVLLRNGDQVYAGQVEVSAGLVTALGGSELQRLDYPSALSKGQRESAWSAGMAVGVHTSYMDLSAGPALQLGLRRQHRIASLAARLGYDLSRDHGFYVGIETHHLSLTVLAEKGLRADPFTFGVGLEAGLVLIRQSFSSTNAEIPLSESQLHGGLFAGPVVTPLFSMEAPLGPRGFLRFEAAMPIRYMMTSNQYYEHKWQFQQNTRLTVGGGFYF